eukprot:478471-Rhodomonas_salina.1
MCIRDSSYIFREVSRLLLVLLSSSPAKASLLFAVQLSANNHEPGTGRAGTAGTDAAQLVLTQRGPVQIMEKPHHLRWIDLSFNNLTEIPAVLGFYAHLTTVYLHANQLQQPTDALVLAGLRELKALTMHGNPCEKADNYRLVVLAACVDLKKLDFASVTKADR